MKINLLLYVLNFVPRAYDLEDWRYSELKQTYAVRIVLSKFAPWSEWSMSSWPYMEKSSTSSRNIWAAGRSGRGMATGHFVK